MLLQVICDKSFFFLIRSFCFLFCQKHLPKQFNRQSCSRRQNCIFKNTNFMKFIYWDVNLEVATNCYANNQFAFFFLNVEYNWVARTKVIIFLFPSDVKWFGFKIGSTKSKGTFRINQAPYTSHLKCPLYYFFFPLSSTERPYSSLVHTHLLCRKITKVNIGKGFEFILEESLKTINDQIMLLQVKNTQKKKVYLYPVSL